MIHGANKNFWPALLAAATLLLLAIRISTRVAASATGIGLTLVLALALIFLEEALLLAGLILIAGSIALGRGSCGTVGLTIRGSLSLVRTLTGIATRSAAFAATTKALLLPGTILSSGGGIPLRRRRRALRLRR
jgi:hypothetical protein